MAYGYTPPYTGISDPMNPYNRPIVPTYQPIQPQYSPQYASVPQAQLAQQPQQPVANTGIQWVQGKEGAKSYQVQPGTSVILMDSERQMFYIKSANGAGMPELHSYAFQEIHEGEAQVITSALPADYVPKSDFEQLKGQFDELQKQFQFLLRDKPQSKKSSLILKGEDE